MKREIGLVVFCIGLFFLVQDIQGQCKPCLGCGNGRCDYPAEDCKSCPLDCGVCPKCTLRCGNGVCESAQGENSCNCPSDCGPCCVNSECREDLGETFENCAADCAASLNGVVFDRVNGTGLVGAAVTCMAHLADNTPPFSQVYGPLATTAGGAFALPTVKPGRYLCQATQTGYDSNTARVTAFTKSCDSARIPLNFRTATLGGTTYNIVTLEPLSNVTVVCTSASGRRLRTTYSAVGGQFFHDAVNPECWTCVGSLEGFSDGVRTECGSYGDHIRMDLYLRPLPGRISGYVRASESGAGIPFVTVTCQVRSNPLLVRTATTATDGFYLVPEFDTGDAICGVSPQGYTPQSKSGLVPRGGLLVLNFTLSLLPARLTGNVTDLNTRLAIPDAAVDCLSITNTPLNTRTEGRGAYSFALVTPSTYNCTASRVGWSSVSSSIIINPGDDAFLPFALQPLVASIIGTVTLTGTGAPISGATVTCTFTDNVTPAPAALTTTDTGGFEYNNLVLNTQALQVGFTCRASRQGFGSGSFSGTLVRGQVARVPISLVLLGITVTVRERFLTGTTGLLSGVSVVCSSANPALTNTTTATGVISFLGIFPGVYNCSGTKEGYVGAFQVVNINEASGVVAVNLTLVLQTYRIVGYVLQFSPDRPPIVGASITIEDTATGDEIDRVSANQQFNASINSGFTFLITLPANITIRGDPNYENFVLRRTLTLANYQNPIVVNLVPKPSIITGLVSDAATGQPILRNVTVNWVLSSTSSYVFTDPATGIYRIVDLVPGNYSLSVSDVTGYTPTSASVSIPLPALTITQNFALVPRTTGTLRGTVVETVNGVRVGIARAVVTLTNLASGRSQTNTTDSNGVYFFNSATVGNSSVAAIDAASAYRQETTFVQIFAAENNLEALLLQRRQGSVQGFVQSQKTGQNPVTITGENILVCIFAPSVAVPTTPSCTGATQSKIMSADGSYSLTNIPEGTYYLFAIASESGSFDPRKIDNVVITEGPALNQNIVMNDRRTKRSSSKN